MEVIKEDQELLKEKVPVGAIFRHYKGKDYKILAVAKHADEYDYYVVYQGLYNCDTFGNFPIWVRSLKVFLETVTIDGEEISRFALTHLPNP